MKFNYLWPPLEKFLWLSVEKFANGLLLEKVPRTPMRESNYSEISKHTQQASSYKRLMANYPECYISENYFHLAAHWRLDCATHRLIYLFEFTELKRSATFLTALFALAKKEVKTSRLMSLSQV